MRGPIARSRDRPPHRHAEIRAVQVDMGDGRSSETDNNARQHESKKSDASRSDHQTALAALKSIERAESNPFGVI